MHPGSLAFNLVPENAQLADKWGIVMGSSHSEALLRNNVGEWNEKTDAPWNYQTNADAMNAYWDKRLVENGKFENFYTVGLRGVHDSGLEASGGPEVKARLVEDAMAEQRKLLAARVNPDVTKIPQIIWLYKESLDLYRVGMKVPDDVTLGWTDDNYGYIRELPDAAEQKRAGGSGVYYHVSYWGAPHDYLWLCTTPPALLQEELTKAYDHNARKYWILNVGDLKPAEIDIDYFMQLATDEPKMAAMSQREFLTQWLGEQFRTTTSDSTLGDPTKPGFPLSTFTKDDGGQTKVTATPSPSLASAIADILTRYYALNFIRKPEFMGFNGYNDGINRTAFNPLAWGSTLLTPAIPLRSNGVTIHNSFKDVSLDQNHARVAAWARLRDSEQAIAETLPPQVASAFFELVGYPVGRRGGNERKVLLATDLTYLDAAQLNAEVRQADTEQARGAYDAIQTLTAKYNSLEGGKWDGMMSDAPRQRHVFEMPRTATDADTTRPLPATWTADDTPAIEHPAVPPPGFHEEHGAVSMNAAHFTRKSDTSTYSAKVGRLDPSAATWNVLADLGISGDSVVYGRPGLLAGLDLAMGRVRVQDPEPTAWLEYDFSTTTEDAPATLTLDLLPTFAVDSEHRLRYAVALDGGAPVEMDLSAPAVPRKSLGAGDGPSDSGWAENVLRNSAVTTISLGPLAAEAHAAAAVP